MSTVRMYILSIIAVSFLCGIVNGLIENKQIHQIMKLLAGLFLLYTIISPVMQIDFSSLSLLTEDTIYQGKQIAQYEKISAMEKVSDIIKSKTEAYILDKANEYGAELEVTVMLSQDDSMVPESVELAGRISANARCRLEEEITNELGISKENQRWIWRSW